MKTTDDINIMSVSNTPYKIKQLSASQEGFWSIDLVVQYVRSPITYIITYIMWYNESLCFISCSVTGETRCIVGHPHDSDLATE
jgi:hypothetical protein